MAPSGRRALAVALALGPVILLVVLAFAAPALTEYLVSEEGPVEWLQAALGAVAAVLGLARARALARAGQPAAFDVVIALLLAAMALGELELDRWLLGTKLIGARFFLRPRKPVAWPWRALAALIVVGLPIGIGIYALTRARQVARSARDALRAPWGRLLVAGFVLFALTQVFERILNRAHFVSDLFVEEALEVVATGCWVAAYVLRSERRTPPVPGGPSRGSSDP